MKQIKEYLMMINHFVPKSEEIRIISAIDRIYGGNIEMSKLKEDEF